MTAFVLNQQLFPKIFSAKNPPAVQTQAQNGKVCQRSIFVKVHSVGSVILKYWTGKTP